jgi:hypothetical protein
MLIPLYRLNCKSLILLLLCLGAVAGLLCNQLIYKHLPSAARSARFFLFFLVQAGKKP